MKKPDVGQTFGILANVGVVVGILLLVYELSLNRQMMRAQTRHDLAQGIVSQITLLATDGELAELIAKVNSGAGDVTEIERNRFQARKVDRCGLFHERAPASGTKWSKLL